MAVLHRGMLFAKSLLRDLYVSVFAQSGRFSQVRSHIATMMNWVIHHYVLHGHGWKLIGKYCVQPEL